MTEIRLKHGIHLFVFISLAIKINIITVLFFCDGNVKI